MCYFAIFLSIIRCRMVFPIKKLFKLISKVTENQMGLSLLIEPKISRDNPKWVYDVQNEKLTAHLVFELFIPDILT